MLGEEKPQPFIPLDIDRQGDAKLGLINHPSLSPPNGRLPMPGNHISPPSMPLPIHQLVPQPNPLTTPDYTLDGGVYQGHGPTTLAKDWNAKVKVNLFFDSKLNERFRKNRSSDQLHKINTIQIIISHRTKLCRHKPTLLCLIHVQVCLEL